MTDLVVLVDGLQDKNANRAYACLQQLEEESARSAAVYPYFDTFAALLDSTNSYCRTRAIVLIAANAKWDTDYKIDEILDDYLKHITDVKPITARQCIKALPTLASGRPDLKDEILRALHHVDVMKYKDSMQPLLVKDIQSALQQISIQISPRID